jgi:hypothetical protein
MVKLKKKQIIQLVTLPIILIASVFSCQRAGKWLIKDDILKHSDAIVLLMDKFPADRILQSLDIYKLGYASHIFMVKENMDDFQQLEKRGALIIRNTEQCKTALVELGVPVNNITILNGKAANIQEEAIIISEFRSKNPELDTLILISSAQNARRASIIFDHTFNAKNNRVIFMNSPSDYGNYRADGWWKRKEDIQKVLSEYFKLLSFWLFT